ncbi:MAG: hypothetical protein M3Y59_20945 [Myxococcota bacterium]|nr:hypothetical protein [Myxococcota bacterium]
MKPQKRGLSSVVLAVVAVLIGLVLFGSLFKLALAAGAVFVVWKVFFDREEQARPAMAPPRMDLLAPPLDLDLHERDAELAHLDRELEQAIQASNLRQKPASLTG